MRSSTPTQFQSSRPPMSSGNTQYNSAPFGSLIPEARLTSFQQRPPYQAPRPAQYETSQYTKLAHEYGRSPVASPHEYGRPPVTSSYPAPVPAFGSDPTIATTRHRSSWLEESRESTLNFKKNGSPVPLVWVRVASIEVIIVAKRSQRSWSRINLSHLTLSLLAKTAMDRRSSSHVSI
jgi:hypothetical protein